MPLFSTTLRPGLLVSMKTAISGDNVDYAKTDIVADHVDETGARIAKWETERTIIDAEEHEKALVVRSKARSLMTSVCSRSDFGLLCPDNKREQLEIAIREARRLCEDFNLTARLTTVEFNVICGRIAADDVEAVRAINSEVRNLIDEMQGAISKLDVEGVRKAANKAKQLGSMLAPDAQARIQEAIDAVRGEAKKIIKAGDAAAIEIDATVLAQLAASRTAFLDIEDASDDTVQPVVEGRAVDLDPEVDLLGPGNSPATPELDIADLM
jgi:hypothetical protein